MSEEILRRLLLQNMSDISLSPEQQEIVDVWGKGMAVTAGAGSGKTTTIVLKCLEYLKRNPEKDFLAVSFTEKSAADLQARLLPKIPTQNGSWVKTIHGFCRTLIQEFPEACGCDGTEEVMSEEESSQLWRGALRRLWSEDLPPGVGEALERLLLEKSVAQIQDLISRLRDLIPMGFYSECQDPLLEDLKTVSKWVLDRYQRSKDRRGVLDFSDLETRALKGLREEPKMSRNFQKKFGLVLVDEFQDTNPVQAQILEKIILPDRSNICVVGDPKQSIYRFRDADVSLFEEFCKTLPVQLALTRNFRSRPGILNWVNDVCAPLFEASDLSYLPLAPAREGNPTDPSLVHLDFPEAESLGKWILREKAQGRDLGKFVLLVRKVRGHEDLFKSLVSAGVPLAIASGGLFWDEPRVRELVSFLKAWDLSGNRMSAAIFLRAPWVGVSDAQIDEWIQNGDLIEQFLESPHELAQILKPSFNKPMRPGDLLIELFKSESLEKSLGMILLQLWHRVEEMSLSGLSFSEIVRELSRSLQERPREKEIPLPKAQGALTVMTIHGSKGLEFDHVILVDFPERKKNAEYPALFWDRKRGAYLGEDENWRKKEKEKAIAESKRLFYVALTRARERLILFLSEPEKSQSLTDDHWRSWISSHLAGFSKVRSLESFEKAELSLDRNGEESLSKCPSRSELISMRRARHSVTEWLQFRRCPRSYIFKFLAKLEADSEPAPSELPFESRTSALTEKRVELGISVHEKLSQSDAVGLRALVQAEGRQSFDAEELVRWMESEDQSDDKVWREFAFEIPMETRFGLDVLVGAMDRVSCRGEKYILTDFKVAAKKSDRYQFQLETYAWALGQLERGAREKTQARILWILPEKTEIQEIELGSYQELSDKILTQLTEVNESLEAWVRDGLTVPRIANHCVRCDFRSRCS